MAEGVGRHALLPNIRQLSGRAPCILADHISGSVTSEWGAAGVAEDGLIGRDSGGHRTQGHCCFRPERANALFAALAMKPHVLRPVQAEFARVNGQGLETLTAFRWGLLANQARMP